MSDGVIHKDSDQGRVASHPARQDQPLLVAPTTTTEFNTLSLPLPAVACVQLADITFEFDSSFVLPGAADVLGELPGLRDQHKSKTKGTLPPLGIFGHADSVGEDEYNKQLSGRRAKAVFALLVHDAARWQSLLNTPSGGDDWRQKGAVATMRNFLGAGAPSAEKGLIQAYMAALFPSALTKSDFVAQGKDPNGKGDFQGCSRFNLAIALSKAEDQSLSHEERNKLNQPSRRVVIFLFRAGSKVDPALWPCPNADAPTAACKKQFFVTPPKGDDRRRLGAVRREHATLEDTQEDTFACRFYDEISHLSPCGGGGVLVQIVGHLFANFDQKQGGQNVDKNETRRVSRILRPGAIILPNLDIDEDPAKPRTRFTTDDTDALTDEKVNDSDDAQEVTLFKIAEPATVTGNAVRVVLQVDPADAQRVRIWKVPKGKTLKDGVVVIGPTQGNRFVVEDRSKSKVDAGWDDDFFVEARVLSNDVKNPPSQSPVPAPPGNLNTPVPGAGGPKTAPPVNATDPSKPMHVKRTPNDVWVELIHETTAGNVPALKDAALFTITPWLMLWNTLDTLRLYVVYMTKKNRPEKFQRILSTENHSTVMDVHEACVIAGLAAPLGPDSSKQAPVTDHKKVRTLGDAKVYIIDELDALGDRWIQDECEIGYCFAPHRALHMVMHVKRMGTAGDVGLGKFVVKEMAHDGLAVYNGIARSPQALSDPNARNLPFTLLDVRGSSINYGGNLEMSPPIPKPTPAITEEFAGPAIKAHPAAPFGKILLGDGTNFQMSGEFLKMLFDQSVQPVLPVDTTWLAVAHLDEIMAIVRANSPRGFSVLLADTQLLERLLEVVLEEDPNATLHAGRCNGTMTDQGLSLWNYGEEFVDQFLVKLPGSVAHLRAGQKLPAIRERLKVGLDLLDLDIVPIPLSFADVPPRAPQIDPLPMAKARTVGLVNMQVVNNVLLVPRPYGPRMSPDKATKVLTKVLAERFGINAPTVSLPSPGDHFFWARPGEALTALAMYFARPANMVPSADRTIRTQLIDKLKALVTSNFAPGDPNFNVADLGPVGQAEVAALRRAILRDPFNGAHITNPIIGEIFTHLDDNLLFDEWMRIHIPTDTVDVMEGYMKSVLEPLGNTVHFVDEFEFYHEAFGEIHCGTNAIRTMPESNPAFTARWWDPGVYDPDRDLSYQVRQPVLLD